MKTFAVVLAATLLAAIPAYSQDGSSPVTREEFERQKKELEALKVKMAELQDKKKDEQEKKKEDQELQQQIEELEKSLKAVKEKTEEQKPGWTKFVLSGFGFAGFEALHGSKSTFSAGFNPVFLWEPTDRLLFEAQIELGLEGNDTTVGLEYATLSYLLNDYVTVGAGRFLTPFGIYKERLHQAWINKLPDDPFVFEDGGIPPEGTIGIEVRGGFGLSESSKMNYAFYVGNSPRLGTDTPEEAGVLFDDNLTDVKDRKTVGGRIGILPIPSVEIGYSFLTGRVGASGTPFSGVNTVMHGPDLSHVEESELLQGTVSVYGQWVWSSVNRATYDPAGLVFGPANFANHPQGGYLQASYRPSKLETAFLKNLEAVVRYDVLNRPHGAPNAVDDRRWTIGLDYWLTPSTVVKLAYEWDKRGDPAGPTTNANGVVIQFAMGF